MNMAVAQQPCWHTRVQALRERGAQHVDPTSMALMARLLQRPPLQADGLAARQWQQRLQRLYDAVERRLAQADQPATTANEEPSAAHRFAPLHVALAASATLRQPLWQRDTGGSNGSTLTCLPQMSGHDLGEQQTALTAIRASQSRHQARQRLAQAINAIPDNAGPLNSQRLISRALQVLNEDAPAYVEQLMAHIDTLIWLQGK